MYESSGLLIGLCFVATSAMTIGGGKTIVIPEFTGLGKVVIDADVGGDDASAILLALAAEKRYGHESFEVIAITCAYGNTILKNVEVNVLKTLTIANRTDIPVYLGADKPLMERHKPDDHFGFDGLGDFEFAEEVKGQIDRSKHASVALVDLAKKYSGELSILALAPLTNIALAMELDPNFANNVKRFYLMGASVHGIGNILPGIEFNFAQDPQGNHVVLSKIVDPPAILLSWETAIASEIPMKWRIEELGGLKSRTIQFMNKVERMHFEDEKWISADVLLVAVAVWPQLIVKKILANVEPIFDGAAMGAVMVDYKGTSSKPKNVEIVDAIDVEKLKELLLMYYA